MGWAATLAAGIGLWLLAASLLWRTSVPADLDPPRLHAAGLFTEAQIHRAAHFSGVLGWLVLGATLAQLAVLAVVAWYGRRLAAAFPVGRLGRGVLVGCVAGTFVWLVTLPFDLALTWWERRYGLLLGSYRGWATDAWLGLGFSIAGATLAILLLMALASALPRFWWLVAAGVVTAIVAVAVALQPLLFLDTHPIRDPQLKAAIERMERREGVTGTKVDIEKVSSSTTAANAFTIGFGPTTRVVLWDTLVDGFKPREVVVVVAHELGHVKSRHILKAIGWSALVALPELFLVFLATRRRGGLGQPAAVPVALLVLSALALVVTPAYNEVSRRYEAEADWRALNASRDPQAAIGLFKGFTVKDLAEPSPPTWDYLLFEDHPTILQRIAMVRAWQARQR